MKFEKLIAWQKALDLSLVIHDMKLTFPSTERYVLSSQMQRAVDSMFLNIAEGSTGQSNAEFNRFLGYSIRSGIEVIGCLHLAKKRGLLNEEIFKSIYLQAQEVIKITSGLKNSLKKKGDEK